MSQEQYHRIQKHHAGADRVLHAVKHNISVFIFFKYYANLANAMILCCL